VQTIAFIPVRGGSKGIPNKNILPLAGKPLVYWTVRAAVEAGRIDRVVVSTDDDRIAATVEAFGFEKVSIFRRSPETATDTASTESAMLEFAKAEPFSLMVLIQATSPLLTSEDLDGALSLYSSEGFDTLLSAVRQKRFLWSRTEQGEGKATNYDPASRPRRQDFDGYLVENGALYITPRKGLLEHGNRLFGRMGIWEMDEASFVELDEPVDWLFVENLILNRNPSNAALQTLQDRAAGIRMVLTDVDGVLTDAGMYYSENGDELKKFNTRDASGLRLLQEKGIRIGIITSEQTALVDRRAKKMGVDFLVQGARDKAVELDKLLQKTGLKAEQVAYIGDDVNDLGILSAVGLAVTPADAQPATRPLAHFVCRHRGGKGAVRELAEIILAAQSGRQEGDKVRKAGK